EVRPRVGPHPAPFVGPVLVRDADVAALAVPHPAVKRALDPVCDDTAAVREAGAEMLTVRIEHLDVTAELSEGDEIPPEVVQGQHVGDGDVGAPGDLKPSGWGHARQGLDRK